MFHFYSTLQRTSLTYWMFYDELGAFRGETSVPFWQGYGYNDSDVVTQIEQVASKDN